LKAKRKKLPGAPIGARNSYVLFKTVETKRLKETQPDLAPDDRIRTVSRNWTLLSKEDRFLWHAREEEDKARYHRELAEFERKLAREEAEKEESSTSVGSTGVGATSTSSPSSPMDTTH
jgi:hypothetical protein